MANNGGGNPNHDEEGKFTSAGNKAAPKAKAQNDPLMSLFGDLFKSLNNAEKSEKDSFQKLKEMGFGEEEKPDLKSKLEKDLENNGSIDLGWYEAGSNAHDYEYGGTQVSLHKNEDGSFSLRAVNMDSDGEEHEEDIKDFPDLDSALGHIKGLDLNDSQYDLSKLEKDDDYDYETLRDLAYNFGYNPKENPEGSTEYIKNLDIEKDDLNKMHELRKKYRENNIQKDELLELEWLVSKYRTKNHK